MERTAKRDRGNSGTVETVNSDLSSKVQSHDAQPAKARSALSNQGNGNTSDASGEPANDLLARWNGLVMWPLNLAAIAFLVAYALPIAYPSLSAHVKEICTWVIWVTWGMYVVDYVIRFSLAKGKRDFFKKNILDLFVVAFPMLRPLRVLQLLLPLTIYNRSGAFVLNGRVAIYAFGAAILAVVIASLAVTNAERGAPGANITNLGDGAWWAITTVTTVGYGDVYPVTVVGRIIATILMVTGMAMLGAVTGTTASWLMRHLQQANQEFEVPPLSLSAVHQNLKHHSLEHHSDHPVSSLDLTTPDGVSPQDQGPTDGS